MVLAISHVYGPHSASDRQILWDELKLFRQDFDGIWTVASDFNITKCVANKRD